MHPSNKLERMGDITTAAHVYASKLACGINEILGPRRYWVGRYLRLEGVVNGPLVWVLNPGVCMYFVWTMCILKSPIGGPMNLGGLQKEHLLTAFNQFL